MTAVVAHRGNSSVAPQNTLAAFESAWRAGADMIELDLRLTRDGEVVVIHDATVDATTDGSGRVTVLDRRAVRSLDAGTSFASAYAGQRVPTFAEVVAFLADRPGLRLLVELKGEWTPSEVRLVAGPLAVAGLTSRVVAQSFSRATVAALRDAAPAVRRGLLLADVPADLGSACASLGVHACNPHGILLAQQPRLLDDLHAAGIQVMVWTLDEPDEWAWAVEQGVDAIITDRPDRLVGWLAGRGHAPLGRERRGSDVAAGVRLHAHA
ncbi:glycerophosphoryl diester phosphodiesterase [Sediminihabitans luteus]|uniref:Glycerophosphoryl diester phosphodiesterase n=1 Tax=Sediminihabitans luteus TaxID=1138585 RepID=A0A2M9D109_9CELL|nr:glycerophosphodiester phosphodiesterase [Sediminihabitans luteus]PJJ77773.1 glycerophosphoryl diester phosphodiesterase [Sediminihabitans luteus]GII99999.1 putative glycerophosphoryl diester phosphodiesterase [Sediminihabitans luteus]